MNLLNPHQINFEPPSLLRFCCLSKCCFNCISNNWRLANQPRPQLYTQLLRLASGKTKKMQLSYRATKNAGKAAWVSDTGGCRRQQTSKEDKAVKRKPPQLTSGHLPQEKKIN
ncbi:MAG: hypothetical protein HC848_00985 [Limnobacter sp.]|nr:hypothetical protein [Limnobacter sp.]